MLMMTLVIVGTILLVAIAALFTFQILNFRANFQDLRLIRITKHGVSRLRISRRLDSFTTGWK